MSWISMFGFEELKCNVCRKRRDLVMLTGKVLCKDHAILKLLEAQNEPSSSLPQGEKEGVTSK